MFCFGNPDQQSAGRVKEDIEGLGTVGTRREIDGGSTSGFFRKTQKGDFFSCLNLSILPSLFYLSILSTLFRE